MAVSPGSTTWVSRGVRVTSFDAAWDRGSTDHGVARMRIGSRRRITIPPILGYGKRGAGGVIGPDETLVFVVDLVGPG